MKGAFLIHGVNGISYVLL